MFPRHTLITGVFTLNSQLLQKKMPFVVKMSDIMTTHISLPFFSFFPMPGTAFAVNFINRNCVYQLKSWLTLKIIQIHT